MVYVAMTRSTLPCSMKGSRLAETVSDHSILSAGMPSLAAISLPISTSKPTGLPSRPFWPKSGWSNLVPMVILPAEESLAMVESAGKLGFSATGGLVVVEELPPQALRLSASAAEAATRRDFLRVKNAIMTFLSLGGRRPAARVRKRSRSVCQQLGQEILGPAALGVVEEFLGGRVLNDLAVGHEHDAVGRLAGEAHLVGDHDHGHPLLGELDHDVQDLVDHFRVKSRGGLIEEHHLGLHGQGAGDGNALLLAAGELGRKFGGLMPDADAFQQRHGVLVGLALGDALDLDRAKGDVFQDGLVGEEVEGLEYHADVGAQLGQFLALGGQFLAIDLDVAVVDGFETVDGAAERGLAGTRRADDNNNLTLADVQVDVLQDVQLAVVLVHGLQGDESIAGHLSSHRTNLAKIDAI